MFRELCPYTFAVFPFLKTHASASIGGLTFRSTTDLTGLTAEQAKQVNDISEMLFLQDNFRVRSASYALGPAIDLDDPGDKYVPVLQDLEDLQAAVAYCYASPHPIFCDPFFRYEHHHVEWVGPEIPLEKDSRGEVEGYRGLYNFKHHFWVVQGSRLYPPFPQISLNIGQDLESDLCQFTSESSHYSLLLGLLQRPKTSISDRILRAIKWFNKGNSRAASEDEAIVNLAVAFESLLELPESDQVTERLVDSISLLLGRIPRLGDWARQLYKARSEVVHKGKARNLRFVVASSGKDVDASVYRSLLAYGQQVFQLCVGALIFGAKLAEQHRLEEKLATNQERFTEINQQLGDTSVSPADRLRGITPKVVTTERYQFIGESNLQLGTVVDAARLAAKVLLQCDHGPDSSVKEHFERLASATASDHYQVLDAIRQLDAVMGQVVASEDYDRPREVAMRLIRLVWRYTFRDYFHLKERLDTQKKDASRLP